MNTEVTTQIFDKIQIIVKVSERCNLNCSYCYYFNGSDQSYRQRPAIFKKDVVEKLISDLSNMMMSGVKINNLDIVFHGGEPLLLKRKYLKEILENFRSKFENKTNLTFGVQTNGTLVDQSFIDLVNEYSIGVGVSIDGNKFIHDKFRVYKSGRGSFDDVVRGIKMLQEGIDLKKAPAVGVISVVSNKEDLLSTYSYLVDEMDIERISFLYPDATHDEWTSDTFFDVNNLGEALLGCVEKWSEKPEIAFKNINDYLDALRNYDYIEDEKTMTIELNSISKSQFTPFRMVIVRSDGGLYHYDRFLPAEADKLLAASDESNIRNIYFLDYLNSNTFVEIDRIYKNKHEKCDACLYKTICGGGDLQHRYSIKNGFNNPSIYCNDIKYLFDKTNEKLIASGYPENEIKEKLGNRFLI
ncbi:4Fe-4S cluster-binding domain-containing protein [Photobacterium sp. CCB-ST2H9]|uniref:radical SAM protein n=1 Tax=Photobacterium sp. CCB-ST2H9 TaxID=2912855 RepID=UPI002006C0D1|nr:radical SAM protein [Photobacterium sp. CCB-ST2H9]UTM59672.1 4Fe-4S cluster-binding domain-containing protein [Photobacterium sp. CCB-ST2H9]